MLIPPAGAKPTNTSRQDIKAPTILDTQASTVSAIEQFAPFKGLKKKEKAELEDKLAPWVDIFVNSLYLARNGKLLYSLLEHVQQLELTPPIDWEAAAIWKGQAFIANVCSVAYAHPCVSVANIV